MKKILLVDDDPGFRKLLSTLIRRAGYEVQEAKEGAEAVAAIEKNVPDLVVLDIVMPIMGGYEVIHYIRFNQKLPNLPILVVSSKEVMQPEVCDAVDVDFFPKSGSANLLIERIKKFFQQSQSLSPGLRDQFAELQKFDNKMVNREMEAIENYIRGKINLNKDTVGPSRPGDLGFE